MKLKAIHTYQTVLFNRKNHNFFTDSKQLDLEGVSLEYLPAIQAVRIQSAKDDILVFVTNISYAIPIDANDVDKIVENRGKLKNIDPSQKPK